MKKFATKVDVLKPFYHIIIISPLKNFKKTLENRKAPYKVFIFIIFCDYFIKTEQLRWKSAQKIQLNKILGAMNTLLYLEERKREDNIIKDIKNLFRLRKAIDHSATKDIRNIFRRRRGNKTIKDKMIRDIKAFEEEDNYYEPIKVGNIWKNDYIEYGSNSDKSKILLVKEYLIEIKLFLEDI